MRTLTGDSGLRAGRASSAWLVVIALICATGLVAVRYSPNFFKDKQSVEPATNLGLVHLSPADAQDLLRHLNSGSASQEEAATDMVRSREWTERALSSLDDPALTARRLELARSTARAAQIQMDHAGEELEIAKEILKERSRP